MFTVTAASDHDRVPWNRFLDGTGTPPLNVFAWSDVLASFGARLHFLIARDAEGSIAGVLPAYIQRSLRGKKRLFSTRHGLVANSDAAARALLARGAEIATAEGAVQAMVTSGWRSYAQPYHAWPKTTVILELPSDRDEAWRTLRDKTRNAIRKGAKSGLTWAAGPELLPQFFDVYSSRMMEKDVPFYPRRYFEAIATSFGSDWTVFVSRLDGRIQNAMLVLYAADCAVYLHGGSCRGSEALSVNHFLLWEVIKDCIGRSISVLDLGESSVGSGVYRFKTMFGGTPRSLHYYDLLRPAASDDAGPAAAVDPSPAAASLPMRVLHAMPTFARRKCLEILKCQGRLA